LQENQNRKQIVKHQEFTPLLEPPEYTPRDINHDSGGSRIKNVNNRVNHRAT